MQDYLPDWLLTELQIDPTLPNLGVSLGTTIQKHTRMTSRLPSVTTSVSAGASNKKLVTKEPTTYKAVSNSPTNYDLSKNWDYLGLSTGKLPEEPGVKTSPTAQKKTPEPETLPTTDVSYHGLYGLLLNYIPGNLKSKIFSWVNPIKEVFIGYGNLPVTRASLLLLSIWLLRTEMSYGLLMVKRQISLIWPIMLTGKLK